MTSCSPPDSRDRRRRPTRARSTSASTTWSRPASGACSTRQPDPRPPTSASTARTTGWATPRRDAVRARDRRRSGRTSPPSRRSTRPALSGGARFERDLELHNLRLALFDARRGPPLGAPRRRPPATSATRSSCCSPAAPPRSPSAWSGSPTASRPCRRTSRRRGRRADGPAGRHLAGGGAALRRRTCRASSPRSGRPPSRASWTTGELARLDRAIARRPASRSTTYVALAARRRSPRADRRLAAGPRALRRAGPPARLRRPGRGRDPRDRLRSSCARNHGGAPRGRPRAGPRRGRADGHRAPQERPPGHLRGARSRATGTRCAAPAPTSSSTTSSPSPTTR